MVKRFVALALIGLVVACKPAPVDTAAAGYAFPEPDAWGITEGPGGPARTFTSEELFQACGYVLGGPGDHEHHNLLVMYDGYLVHPWAPEDGGGGISFFDATDPCEPQLVGQTWDDRMRETHTLAFGQADDREYLAVDYLDPDDGTVGGVGFWDITDRSAPVWVSQLATPNFSYPDSYLRVTFSSFWLGDVLYHAGAFNGLHVIDASDPLNPVLVRTVTFEGLPHMVGSFTVVGDVGIAASASTARVVTLDVSDPFDPRPIPGGDILGSDATGEKATYYFSSIGGKYGLFARKMQGGGPIVYDLTDPAAPAYVGEHYTPEGDGGYVYRQSDRLFFGDSNFGSVYDFSDPAQPVELERFVVGGDMDTLSPIGNVMVVSVDSGAPAGQASSVFPHALEPDSVAPVVEWFRPMDGQTGLRPTTAIGVSFDEWVEAKSVFQGSFRVKDEQGDPVPGQFNTQESVVNFSPSEPLKAKHTYTVSVEAGGITDISGNATDHTTTWSFTTGPAVP